MQKHLYSVPHYLTGRYVHFGDGMKIRWVVIFCSLSIATSQASTLVNIPELIGKTPKQVASILEKPGSCSKSKYGEKCSYAVGETEIVFINGKADWITVEGLDSIPFNQNALASLGITPKAPTFQNNFSLRWNSIMGIREITIFKGTKDSDYAYIKAFTE